MSRKLASLAPVVSLTLALSFLAGCGQTPTLTTPVAATQKSVKMEAAARKETRRQAESRAKRYIAEFEDTNYRSIRSRSAMVEKIARTDADAAYDFLLQEIENLQELRGEMPKLTRAEYEDYEELLLEQLDEMTPDQQQVRRRVEKAESMGLDLDELTILEEIEDEAMGMVEAQRARVGSRNRLLTAIQESKLYKSAKKAYKNTKKKVKKFLSNLWKKLRWR